MNILHFPDQMVGLWQEMEHLGTTRESATFANDQGIREKVGGTVAGGEPRGGGRRRLWGASDNLKKKMMEKWFIFALLSKVAINDKYWLSTSVQT